MKNTYYLLILLLILTSILHQEYPQKVSYPATKKEKIFDTYFDTIIADPYRWLEDENSSMTKAWITKQNSLTSSYFRRISHFRKIKNRLREIWNYPWHGVPFIKGNKIYYYANNGLENHPVLYVQENEDVEPDIILDPNKFSTDGTISLSGIYFSNDNRYMGYSLSISGSDWREFFIMDLNTKKVLDDRLKWIKFSGMSWHKNGFYYTRYPEQKGDNELTMANEYSKVFYHKIGTHQESDELIYYNHETPRISPYVISSNDEEYLFLYKYQGTYGNSLAFRDLRKNEHGWTSIIDDFNSEIRIIDYADGLFFVITDRLAPNKRILTIDPDYPEEKNWTTLLNGSEDLIIHSCNIIGKKLFVHFTKNVLSIWKVFDLKGNYLYDIDLPGNGIIDGFDGNQNQTVTWYTFNNIITPETIYKYDISNNNNTLYKESESYFKSEDYVLKQEFYKSNDSTEIPIFIAHKKDLNLDNQRPTLLYGYGGFNISMKPYFNKALTIILENDGVYALANIRGGNEFGENWHKDGMLLNKQNVFDDFIGAAEYLFIKGYTDSNYLAIHGRSNGGLLIGAILNQNPQLCRVAFPDVGVMDMLRYEKFTIGYAWSVEYGSVNNRDDFNNLLSYSPLHNIITGTHYPSVLIYTADHDDRVVPAHSFKYAATMQNAQTGDDPILIRVSKNSGHGRGRSTKQIINEYSEKWAFMFYEMGINY
tara:strand:- start:1890 stop:4007 length:2118 start_codon:yes stop_codon:yes gene_type:complete